MNVKPVKLAELTPDPKNTRRHDKRNIEVIKESLSKFGQYRAFVVQKQGMIIRIGNGMYQAMKELGWTEADAEIKELTDKEAAALSILDNRSSELAEWDNLLLAEELQGLPQDLIDLTGFNLDDINALIESVNPKEIIEDEPPEVPEVAKTEPGRIYQLGNHRLLCGDGTKEKDVKRLMGNEKADLYLTDPPYNVSYKGKTKDALTIENDSMNNTNFKKFLVDLFKCADSSMKDGAVFYIWHADSEGFNFRGACFDVGWQVRQNLIWNKNSMVLGRQDYHWKHEPCLYGWKNGSHKWTSDRKQTTIIEWERPQRSTEHPTMKPVGLMTYQLQNNTHNNDIVMDLCGGCQSQT